jgi:hypothetical protein
LKTPFRTFNAKIKAEQAIDKKKKNADILDAPRCLGDVVALISAFFLRLILSQKEGQLNENQSNVR